MYNNTYYDPYQNQPNYYGQQDPNSQGYDYGYAPPPALPDSGQYYPNYNNSGYPDYNQQGGYYPGNEQSLQQETHFNVVNKTYALASEHASTIDERNLGFINVKQIGSIFSSTIFGSVDAIYERPFRVSESLQDSLEWFNNVRRELKNSNRLFSDPHFPADDKSLFYHERPRHTVKWLRPTDIVGRPQFISGGMSRFDVRQGELGDCWLLAAIASLSMHPELMSVVIPEGQDFEHNYCGAFLFRFWQFGQWIDVVVDDFLPTVSGELIYMQSKDTAEYWSALLEKAYAKLQGCYENLKGGSANEALEDFTGGISMMVSTKEHSREAVWSMLVAASLRMSLMGCSIDAPDGEIEGRGPHGLITGHAYSITSLATVNSRQGQACLVRVRNPWGNEKEWTGPWSDNSAEWRQISASERQALGLNFDDDGEFWMSVDDFHRYFTTLEICHLSPDTDVNNLFTGKKRSQWQVDKQDGHWLRNVSAGGCRNNLQSFHMNPQFRVTVSDPDVSDNENLGTLIVGLMQKNMRQKRREGKDLLTIGYAIYRLTDQYQHTLLDTNFFRRYQSCAKSPCFINTREICGTHKLEPGNYVIIPSTFEPNEEADFLLRIFTEHPGRLKELDDVTEYSSEPIFDADERTKDIVNENLTDREEEQLQKAFLAVAGDALEIDAYELQKILNHTFKKEFTFEGFGIETARSLCAHLDSDGSGRLGFPEFKMLWSQLRLWKTIFKRFDVDKKGDLTSCELRSILQTIGFTLSNRIFNPLVTRYCTRDGRLLFDDYILLVIRIKTVFECYKRLEKSLNDPSKAIIDQDTFLEKTLYV